MIVENCVISDDIAECCFGCDLAQCKGQCCVEGDAGAPLEEEEIPLLRQLLPYITPYMTPEGREAVAAQGVAVEDAAGNPCTPLVNDRECAFVTWGEDGTAYCAIEKSYREAAGKKENADDAQQQLLKARFPKPVSCHLYPIRVEEYGEFVTVNYHQWHVCNCARAKDNPHRKPLYEYLREPLIRRFGEAWYEELRRTVISD